MAYCTKTDIENYLQVGISSTLDTQVTAWIAAVQAWIDRYTNRTFESSSMVKKYDGKGRHYLIVDDLLSLSKVFFTANDSTSDANTRNVPTTEFHLYQDDDPNKTPYNKLLLKPFSSYGTFPLGAQNIVVDATFGFATTAPADIQLVATKLVASIVKVGKDDSKENFSQGDLAISYVQFDKIINMDLGVKQILDFYKKQPLLTGFNMIRI